MYNGRSTYDEIGVFDHHTFTAKHRLLYGKLMPNVLCRKDLYILAKQAHSFNVFCRAVTAMGTVKKFTNSHFRNEQMGKTSLKKTALDVLTVTQKIDNDVCVKKIVHISRKFPVLRPMSCSR